MQTRGYWRVFNTGASLYLRIHRWQDKVKVMHKVYFFTYRAREKSTSAHYAGVVRHELNGLCGDEITSTFNRQDKNKVCLTQVRTPNICHEICGRPAPILKYGWATKKQYADLAVLSWLTAANTSSGVTNSTASVRHVKRSRSWQPRYTICWQRQLSVSSLLT